MTDSNPDLVPPTCGPTIERLQLVLDGELPAAALDADPHPAACAACRQRIAAARLVLRALAAREGTAVPANLTDNILAQVRDDRVYRTRRRTFAVAGGIAVALAASVLLMSWFTSPPQEPVMPLGPSNIPDQAKGQPNLPVTPEPQPVRIGEEFSKVGQALRDTSNPIAEPAAKAQGVLATLTGALTRPVAPATEFEPTRKSLAELPEVARSGFEPVTATTQKAFSRLLRDVGSMQVSAKPKS